MTVPIDLNFALLEWLYGIAIEAGHAIMRVYDQGETEIRRKGDHSPVTDADDAAEKIILAQIRGRTPAIPAISEEEVAGGINPIINRNGCFWLIDPLDGTKEFIARNGEFTVNIGLVLDHRPIAGILHAPALNIAYGGAQGVGAYAWRQGRAAEPIHARACPVENPIVVSSRSHLKAEALQDFMRTMRSSETHLAGSALKFGLLAEGVADLYPRFGPTMEWDTAAGHAILEAAGGSVSLFDGTPLSYGKDEYRNPHFIARGAPAP